MGLLVFYGQIMEFVTPGVFGNEFVIIIYTF